METFEILVDTVVALVLVYLSVLWHSHKRPKNFPKGPTGLPILGYLPFLGKFPHIKYSEIQKKFGSIFTLNFGNYPVVVLNDFESIKEAMTRTNYHGRPDLLPLLARGEGEKVGMALNEGREWEEQRRFMMKNLRDLGFGKTMLEPVIQEEVDEAIQHIRSFVGKPAMSFSRFFNTYIINSLWRILTGEKTSKDDPRFQYVMKTVVEGIIQTEMVGPCYFMPWFAKLCPDLSGFNRYLSSIPPTRALMKEIIKTHQQNFDPDNPIDFTDVYLNQIKKETDPTSSFYADRGLKNLTYVLMDLFSAGSETTSAAICWSLLYLTHHPEAMKKIQEEIDTVIGRSRSPCLADRKDLPYTEAVMWETMRKATIVLGFMSKTMENSTFRGYDLPKGTILMPNLWSSNHDEKYWGDPENFRPERFITPEGNFKLQERVLAFGIGRRNCPGQSLAILEYFLFLTTILQNFDFSFDPSQPKPSLEPLPGIALTPQPFSLVVKERQSSLD